MARDFEREVTVYVWRYLSVKHMGHSSLKLRGAPNSDAYISWWPEDSDAGSFEKQGGKSMKGYKNDMYNEIRGDVQERLRRESLVPRSGQRVVREETTIFGNVVNHFGQEADEKIKLPGLGSPGVIFGLDIVRMAEWWNIFQACPHPQYKMVSKHTNCTGVAAAALKVGGAEQYVKAPSAVFFIDPNQIAKWARELRAELYRLNESAKRMAIDLEDAEEAPKPGLVMEIMSLAEWMTLSNKNMGGAWMRSDRVKKIDSLMKKYHALTWDHGTAGDTKFDLLGQIMDAIHSYLIHKPGSKRGDSVLALGKQVLAAAKYKALEYRKLDAWAR